MKVSEGLERLYLQRHKSRGLTPLSSETRTKTKYHHRKAKARTLEGQRDETEKETRVLTRRCRIG